MPRPRWARVAKCVSGKLRKKLWEMAHLVRWFTHEKVVIFQFAMLVYQRVADCCQSEETDTVITDTLKIQSFKAKKKIDWSWSGRIKKHLHNACNVYRSCIMFYTLSVVFWGAQRLVLCDQWECKQANTVTWTSIVCGKQQARVFYRRVFATYYITF